MDLVCSGAGDGLTGSCNSLEATFDALVDFDDKLGVGFCGVGNLALDNDVHCDFDFFTGFVTINHSKLVQYSNLLHRFALASFAHHSFSPQPQLLGPMKFYNIL